MKKISIVLLISILTAGILPGCGKKEETAEEQTIVTSEQSPTAEMGSISTEEPSIEAGEDSLDSSEKLKKIAALLGQKDEQVVEALGEGTPNFMEDTKELNSREYNIPILNADSIVGISYENQKVYFCTVTLPGEDLDGYLKGMETIFGAYTSTEEDKNKEEGNGKKAYIWKTENAVITLIQVYGSISINMEPLS